MQTIYLWQIMSVLMIGHPEAVVCDIFTLFAMQVLLVHCVHMNLMIMVCIKGLSTTVA